MTRRSGWLSVREGTEYRIIEADQREAYLAAHPNAVIEREFDDLECDEDGEPQPSDARIRRWLWILLIATLMICAIGVAINLRP